MVKIISIIMIFFMLSLTKSCAHLQERDKRLKQRVSEFYKKFFLAKIEEAKKTYQFLCKEKKDDENYKRFFLDMLQKMREESHHEALTIKFLEIKIEGNIANVDMVMIGKYRDIIDHKRGKLETGQIRQIDEWIYEENDWFLKVLGKEEKEIK